MLKRILTLSLSLMMIISLCASVSVFAAESKPAAIVEDFEDGVVDTAIVDFNSAVSKEVADGAGRGGGKALKITNLKNTACIGFSASYRPDYDALVLSYDIQVSKVPDPDTQSNKEMVMAGSKSGGGNKTLSLYRKLTGSSADFSFKTYDGDSYDLEIGEWYRIVTVRTGYTISTWVLDTNSNVLLYQTRAEIGAQDEFSIIRGTTNAMGDDNVPGEDGEIMLDNISFTHYDAAAFGPSQTDYEIKKNDDGLVPRNTTSVTVSFDGKIVPGDAVLKYTDKNETEQSVACTVAAATVNGKEIPLTYTVSWERTLESNTEYTLDLTGLKNEKDKSATGTITFTTLNAEDIHLWKKVAISSVVTNTLDETETDISFTLEDNPEYANTEFEGAIMAVLYQDGVMKDFAITEEGSFKVGNAPEEENTVSFSLGTLPENGYEIWLIQMDTASGLTPLAFGKYPVE